MGRKSFAIKMDSSRKDWVMEVVTRAPKGVSSIDILVNNATILNHTEQITDQKDEFWEKILRVNHTGAYNCSRAVLPDRKEKRWGRIISMASVAGTFGGFGQVSYSTIKVKVIGFSKTLALEGARYPITYNVVYPGIITSDSLISSFLKLGRG